MHKTLVMIRSIVIGFALLLWGAVWLQGVKCDYKTSGMTLPHKYSWPAGCRVQDPEAGWVPLDNYRVF